jgi:ATP-binding cassette subfamily B protein
LKRRALPDVQNNCTEAVILTGIAPKINGDEVVSKLDSGMDQLLGRRFESGVDLSGEEWQKIALARAYIAMLGS